MSFDSTFLLRVARPNAGYSPCEDHLGQKSGAPSTGDGAAVSDTVRDAIRRRRQAEGKSACVLVIFACLYCACFVARLSDGDGQSPPIPGRSVASNIVYVICLYALLCSAALSTFTVNSHSHIRHKFTITAAASSYSRIPQPSLRPRSRVIASSTLLGKDHPSLLSTLIHLTPPPPLGL